MTETRAEHLSSDRLRARVFGPRRHLKKPAPGHRVRTHENARRIERLIAKGRARVLAISARRDGTRLDASVRVLVQRPIQPGVALPESRDAPKSKGTQTMVEERLARGRIAARSS